MPTTEQDLEQLTKLGRQDSKSERKLEAFPNHHKGLKVTAHCTEFTCFCPLTHQPDFAQIEIEYYPNEACLESKSLKLYLESFREEGVFHEHLAYDIAKDIMDAITPFDVKVTVKFNIRGGIAIEAQASLNSYTLKEFDGITR